MSNNANADASVAQSNERSSQLADNSEAVSSASKWCIRTRELLGLNQLPLVQEQESIKDQPPVPETNDYPDKRREILKRYYATLTPNGATKAQIGKLEAQRKALLEQLPEVGEEANIIQAGEELEALKGLIQTVQLEIDAKVEHLKLLEVARQKVKVGRSKFPMPSPNSIDKLFDEAQKAGENASTVEDFKNANDMIQKVSDAIDGAEEFTKLYDEMNGWLMTGAQNILTTGQDTLKNGKKLATDGKFTDAIKELKTIRDHQSLKNFADYDKALKEFWTAASGMGKNVEPLSSLLIKDGDFYNAKQQAPQFADAAQSIRNLIPTLQEMKQYYDKLIVVTKITEQKNLFEKLQQNQQELLTKGVEDAKEKAKNKEYIEARNILNNLISLKNDKNKEWISEISLYLQNLNAVYPTYTALLLIAKQSKASSTAEKRFQDAKSKAQNQDFSGAATDLDELKKFVMDAYEYYNLKDKVIDLCIELPQEVVKDQLKPAQESADQEKYTDATSKLQDLLSSLKHLGPYFARKREVESLKKLLDTDRQNELNDVLLRAEAEAKDGDFASGLGILQEIQQMPGLREADSDLSAFLKQLATVSKTLDGTLKLLKRKKPEDQPELPNSLTAKLEEAKLVLKGSEPDIRAGVDLLDELAELLQRVNTYGEERLKAYAMANFLKQESDKLETEVKLWEKEKTSLEQEKQTLQDQVSQDNKVKDTLSNEVKNIKIAIKTTEANKSIPPLAEQELKKVLEEKRKELETKEKTFKEKLNALQELKRKVLGLQGNVEKLKGFVEQSKILLPKLKINAEDTLAKGDQAGLGLNFEEAIKHYQDACSQLKSSAEALVYQLEKIENGHCLSAHGPLTGVGSQQTRVMTGTRPDGPKMPSQFGCMFDKIEDFIMTRQLAFEMAKENSLEPNWTLGSKVLKLDKNGKGVDSITYYIEHDRPIDTAVMGLKANQVVRQSGPEVGEVAVGDTYETLLTVKGLTRTRSTFNFVRSQEPDQNNEVKGKWVLHQQFPEAKDWEPAEPFIQVDDNNKFQSTSGRYTAPLPGV